MSLKLSELIKDKSKIDLKDICSEWNWLISGQKNVLFVTVFGDIFFVGLDDEINWLDTGVGKLTRVAESVTHFEELLKDNDFFSDWFMTNIYLDIQKRNILLKDNEVYSYIKMPLLGGDYTADNIEPTDISVHFSITGQICKKTKNLPDGTKINITTFEKKPWWKMW
jgi:hypothetical protein